MLCIMIMSCGIALDVAQTWVVDQAEGEGRFLYLRSYACPVAAYVHGGGRCTQGGREQQL